MPTIDLGIGRIDYRVLGPDDDNGPVAVFVHGFLVNGTLWDPVAERLAESGVRCIVPDWPLGAHGTPIPTDVELSPGTIAGAVLELLDALDLHDVVLVGNDTGGGLCQLALAGRPPPGRRARAHQLRCIRAVPTTVLRAALPRGAVRSAVWAVAQSTRPRWLRHSPFAFGPLMSRPRPRP